MQDHPDAPTLLAAVARWLGEDLVPAVKEDRALAFRARIAAYLIEVVARELNLAEEHDAAQLGRLLALFDPPDELVESEAPSATRIAIATLEAEVADRIRAEDLGPAERFAITAHVTETLREKLAIVQPRFDTSPDIEGEPRDQPR